MYERPYLDSSVYIAAIKNEVIRLPDGTEERRGELAENIIRDAENGRYPVIASTFLRVEVNRDRSDDVRADATLSAGEADVAQRYFDHGFIQWVELSIPLADTARQLARTHRLRPADAVHLASAISGRADVLLRWDTRWADGVFDGIEVRDPYWEGQPEIEGFPGTEGVE